MRTLLIQEKKEILDLVSSGAVKDKRIRITKYWLARLWDEPHGFKNYNKIILRCGKHRIQLLCQEINFKFDEVTEKKYILIRYGCKTE